MNTPRILTTDERNERVLQANADLIAARALLLSITDNYAAQPIGSLTDDQQEDWSRIQATLTAPLSQMHFFG